jgi:hypothetical protein
LKERFEEIVRKAIKHRPHKTKEGYDDPQMDLAYRVGYGHAMLYVLEQIEKAEK